MGTLISPIWKAVAGYHRCRKRPSKYLCWYHVVPIHCKCISHVWICTRFPKLNALSPIIFLSSITRSSTVLATMSSNDSILPRSRESGCIVDCFCSDGFSVRLVPKPNTPPRPSRPSGEMPDWNYSPHSPVMPSVITLQ